MHRVKLGALLVLAVVDQSFAGARRRSRAIKFCYPDPEWRKPERMTACLMFRLSLRRVLGWGAAADAGRGSAGQVGLAPRQEGLLLGGRGRREPVRRCGQFPSGGAGDSSTAVRECLAVKLCSGPGAQPQAAFHRRQVGGIGDWKSWPGIKSTLQSWEHRRRRRRVQQQISCKRCATGLAHVCRSRGLALDRAAKVPDLDSNKFWTARTIRRSRPAMEKSSAVDHLPKSLRGGGHVGHRLGGAGTPRETRRILTRLWPSAWHLTADDKCRAEHIERIR